jgi:hypothetical protein
MCTAFSIAGIALSLTACSATRAGTPSAAATSSAAVPQGSYVALGDSYTAGPDIPDQAGVTAGCEQSSSSYPYLVAQSLRLHLTDMSCSSATIASLNTPQSTGDGTNPAQLNALSAATSLVTLGIGGNDVDWAAVRHPYLPGSAPGQARSAADRARSAPGPVPRRATSPGFVREPAPGLMTRRPHRLDLVL